VTTAFTLLSLRRRTDWGLRAYGTEPQVWPDGWRGELGAEPTPALFVEHLVEVFRGVKRVLRDDGLLWLNMGDSYVSGQGGRQSAAGALPCAIRHDRPNPRKRDDVDVTGWGERAMSCRMYPGRETGLKPKDLCEMPSRVVRALQEPYYTGRIKCEADRIWLAAIVDGEGSIFMHRQPAGTPTGRAGSTRTQDSFCAGIDVSNCSESLVRRVQGLFGNDSFRRIPEGGNRREHYTTRVTGNKAKKILTEIYPYLVAKQHEARLAIGCPASGTAASDYWTALKALHKTGVSTVDCNEPDVGALWEKGWWLRSRIPWVKRNPMPESTTDRPSSAVEYVFLLAKSARPFYDGEAVHIPGTPQTRKATPTERLQERTRAGSALCVGSSEHSGFDRDITTAGRARRNSDWFFESWQGLYTDDDGEPLAFIVNPVSFKGSHFATFPPKLVEPMIKAGTSEKGCCPTCGAPWRRVLDRQRRATRPGTDTKTTGDSLVDGNRDPARHVTDTQTLGWRPTCECGGDPVPCTVLDPFAGSGTTLGVAAQLGRRAVGIELKAEYVRMASDRIKSMIEPATAVLDRVEDAPLFRQSGGDSG